MLGERVSLEPSDLLSSNLDLVVDSLDGEEDLSEALRSHHVELPLGHESGTVDGEGRREGRSGSGSGGEEGEEGKEGKSVGKVSKSIGEGGVPIERGSSSALAFLSTSSSSSKVTEEKESSPLLEDVVESVNRSPLLQTLRQRPLSPSDSPTQLLGERLVLSKLGEDGLVEEVLDILSVVEGSRSGGSLVGSLRARGDSREDSFEDTESSEVGEGALQLLQGLVSGGVVLGG